MFSRLATCLAQWPDQPVPAEPMPVDCHERLRQALLGRSIAPETVGRGDLAGLVGHVLKREALLESPEVKLKVPRAEDWPDPDMWRDHGLEVVLEGREWIQLASRPWYPDWLTNGKGPPPLEAAFREVVRRPEMGVPIDPFLQETLGKETYRRYTCPGQRMAVRSALLAPEGAVLVVDLPTGAGKSLVTWALALTGANEVGLTVVVVPTVALALDQSRRATGLFRDRIEAGIPLVWHAGLTREDRKQVLNRIRQGTQGIIFASPESLVGGVAPVLYEVAPKGLLRNLVVDEAHLVSQWGGDFRPEFQAMAGLTLDLRRRCPAGRRFKTVLMTATLTTDAYETLAVLYGAEVSPLIVAEARVRPEPSYYAYHARSEGERVERVLELLRHLPRPLILYVTRREDTEHWRIRLQAKGLRRVGVLHGGSTTEERLQVVTDWQRDDIDMVVATSAFGLGMDKSGVRAVVHACVPETLDRFYQEVGRGGRDGKACVSCVIYTDSDLEQARGLSKKRLITIEKGLERWNSMLATTKPWGDEADVVRVDLDAKPLNVYQDSQGNKVWNLRTLVLMARAGLVRLEGSPPPQLESTTNEDDQVSDDDRTLARDRFVNSLVLRVEEGHLDLSVWEARVEPLRRRAISADRASFKALRAVLSGDREIAEVLCETYRLDEAGVVVAAACGGCPACRRAGREGIWPGAGLVQSPGLPPASVDPSLRDVFGKEICFLPVTYSRPGVLPREQRGWRRMMLALFLRLIALGILEIATDETWLEERDFLRLYRHAPGRFLFHTSLRQVPNLGDQLPVPRVTLLGPEFADRGIPDHVLSVDSPLHLVLVPEDIRSLVSSHKRLTEVDNHINLRTLLRRLGA